MAIAAWDTFDQTYFLAHSCMQFLSVHHKPMEQEQSSSPLCLLAWEEFSVLMKNYSESLEHFFDNAVVVAIAAPVVVLADIAVVIFVLVFVDAAVVHVAPAIVAEHY